MRWKPGILSQNNVARAALRTMNVLAVSPVMLVMLVRAMSGYRVTNM